MKYGLHDIVQMKKAHPCGANRWQIIRMGADIKIQCLNCKHIVMTNRHHFERKLKKVIKKAPDDVRTRKFL